MEHQSLISIQLQRHMQNLNEAIVYRFYARLSDTGIIKFLQ